MWCDFKAFCEDENMTDLKDIFLAEVERSTDTVKEVAVALSSGIDSTAVMLSILELKQHVRAYTFHVEGVESQDLIHARINARKFGVELVECVIPKTLDVENVYKLIRDYNLRKKVDIECVYPFLYVFPKVEEVLMLTGGAADGHFCISKKGMIHFRHTLEKMNEFRDNLFSNPDYSQRRTLNNLGWDENIVGVYAPFGCENVREFFRDKTWEDINRPKQKQTLTDMFPDQFAKIKRFNHTNLQCGDSMIREVFEVMLDDSTINKKNRTRMMDLYRDLYFEFHPEERKQK